jgi:putative transposase
MAFWRTYFHLIWGTQDRALLIDGELEPRLHGYIVGRAQALGCVVYAIGGVSEHVHLVVSIPPRLSVADFVQKVKGSSSHFVNHDGNATHGVFGWQRGYGVLSLGSQQLDRAVSYVRGQKAHHEQGTTVPMLELAQDDDEGPAGA